MAEFAYSNTKNTNTSYISVKLNCRYYFYVSYKQDLDFSLKLKTAKELFSKLQNLIAVC